MPRITVPAALTGGSASETIAVGGATVREAFEEHAAEYGPELRDSVIDDGEIKEFINVYVEGEEVGHLDGLDTPVGDDDGIRVIPAASGGRDRTRGARAPTPEPTGPRVSGSGPRSRTGHRRQSPP